VIKISQSQNGYSVVSLDDCRLYRAGGIAIPLRDDACGFVLAEFARRFHKRVERLGPTETFGYSYREIAGTDVFSNHASGTALDLNSAQHPQGKRNTFTTTELANLRALLDEFDDVLRWGGDYNSTVDEMHVEVDADYTSVKNLADELYLQRTVKVDRVQPGKENVNVYVVKLALRQAGYFDGPETWHFGPYFQKCYRNWQLHLGYTGADADGVPGVSSLGALGLKVA
jgi:hypothetical protein